MWYLKYKYKHSDCIYADKLIELGLNGYFYHLGEYVKGGYVFTSAMIQLIGEESLIKKYVRYLKSCKAVVKIEICERIIFILTKHKADLSLYEAIYNPILIYPAPAYLSKDGYEIIEVASWERGVISKLIDSIEKNKTTTYFEILQFKDKKLEDIYVSKFLPKIPEKQKEAINLAFRNGYYNYPRNINLDKLSKILKVSKQAFRENLRKAEVKIIPKFVSE